jgi:hypothetical protein
MEPPGRIRADAGARHAAISPLLYRKRLGVKPCREHETRGRQLTAKDAKSRLSAQEQRRSLMGVLRYHMDVDVPVPVAFDHLLVHFRALGYRTEEADRMNFRLVMDRGTFLGSLLGLPVRWRGIWMRAYLVPRQPDGTQISFTFRGFITAINLHAQSVYEEELRQVEEELRAIQPPAAPTPPGPREIIVREIVRIPCRYCGTLVDQTVRKCPDCGAPLG